MLFGALREKIIERINQIRTKGHVLTSLSPVDKLTITVCETYDNELANLLNDLRGWLDDAEEHVLRVAAPENAHRQLRDNLKELLAMAAPKPVPLLHDSQPHLGLQLLDVKIVQIEPEDEPGVLNGICMIMGVEHHATFVRVEENPDGEQHPTNDPSGEYEKMQEFYDGTYVTIELPGWFPGRYVVVIHPFCE